MGSTARFRSRAPYLYRLAAVLDRFPDRSVGEVLSQALARTDKPLWVLSDDELLALCERIEIPR